MKFILQVIAVIAAGFILELIMPWWCIAIAAFLGGYVLKSNANFLAGFLGIALLWATKAWLIDSSAAEPLTEKVAAIFTISKTMLFMVTALIGGVVGGFACMSGASLKKEKRRYY